MKIQDNDSHESTIQSRATGILDAIDALISVASGETNANGKPIKEVDPLEQVNKQISFLQEKVGAVDGLQAQVASLPSKEDIVSSVLARVPEPNCSCKKDELNRPLGGGGGSDTIMTTSDQLSGGE